MAGQSVAIITARGGSKRIPRKNIKEFLGVPVIKYAIDAALASGCFDEVMVSTDDKEISEIARRFNARIPFLRSAETSHDFATTADVIEEVLLEYKKIGRNFEYFCCIYATAPFVSPGSIQQGYDILKRGAADTVLPVVRFSSPIQRAFTLAGGRLQMLWPENKAVRSQDLPIAYHDAGQFYWGSTAKFLQHKSLFTDNTLPIELLESQVQDIDTLEDWKVAEIKYTILKNNAGENKGRA